jgi:hypothetical protein
MQIDIDALIARVDELVEADQREEAWKIVEPLKDELLENERLASRWLTLSEHAANPDEVAETATAIVSRYTESWQILSHAGDVLTTIAEQRPFDEPPLVDGPAAIAADALRRALELLPSEMADVETRAWFDAALAMALRITGADDDAEALMRMRRAVELKPEDGELWYKLGLLHKWRGRWREGVEANERALALGNDTDAVRWNLTICATGAGDGALALQMARSFGAKVQLGADGLPTGLFDPVQVRVSTLGEGGGPQCHVIGADVNFENLWIDRKSLCHGVIMNATYNDLVVDYGDVVLFDGAPVGYRNSGERRVPRFPLLQRLREGDYHRFWFIAQQPASEAVQQLSDPDEAWTFYVHSEQVHWICRRCATNEPDVPHEHSESEQSSQRVVTGKLVVRRSERLERVAAVLNNARDAAIYVAVPALFEELGDNVSLRYWAELWDKLGEGDIITPVTVATPAGEKRPKWWTRLFSKK